MATRFVILFQLGHLEWILGPFIDLESLRNALSASKAQVSTRDSFAVASEVA